LQAGTRGDATEHPTVVFGASLNVFSSSLAAGGRREPHVSPNPIFSLVSLNFIRCRNEYLLAY
jgi:hypothetical protein